MYDLSHSKHAIEYFANEKGNNLCSLLLKKWHVLKELLVLLQIPYKATLALQRRSLTLSDAYIIWQKMEILLKSAEMQRMCRTNFRECLLNAVNRRKNAICDSPTTWSALFLDPRYRHVVLADEEKKSKAIELLANLWHRIKYLHDDNQAVQQRY